MDATKEDVRPATSEDFPESDSELVWAYVTAVAHATEAHALRILDELIRRGAMVPIPRKDGITFQLYDVADWVEL